jgi:poly-gamma-glutamate synthesis protein (capsule biosynthesis protein)
MLICLMGIASVLLIGCNVATATPPASTPVVIPPTLWVAGYIPREVAQSVVLPGDWRTSDTAGSATARLEIGDQNIVGRWVYALVAPFPTVIDNVSDQEIKSAWQGNPSTTFGARLLMDQTTLDVFSAWWGQPGDTMVTVAPADELSSDAWSDMVSWAIIPFDQIEPHWKVLTINGDSPIHKDFDINSYALTVPFSLNGSILPPLQNASPSSNRDPDKLTTVITTGTTALVRGTAVSMEENGPGYPAEEIASVLQNADITHVSNEVAFWQDCPPPALDENNMIFCSDPRYIQLLVYIGTDVVELSGDHLDNYGPLAMLQTLKMYKDRGWKYYGGGANLHEGLSPATFTHNGNKIAFIGCNAKDGSYATASDTFPGAAACGFATIHAEIQHLKQDGYVVIATLQDQEYYQNVVAPEIRPDFTGMVDAGADIVSGSQSHVPQNFEFYKNGFIDYGPGNLFFDQYNLPGCDQAFIDRHVIYDGKYINTELITIKFVDYARSRFMSADERSAFLRTMFPVSGWKVRR